MLSLVLIIATGLLVLVGIGYAVYNYLPYITDLAQSVIDAYGDLSALVPDWLAWLLVVPFVIFGVGLLIKLL